MVLLYQLYHVQLMSLRDLLSSRREVRWAEEWILGREEVGRRLEGEAVVILKNDMYY